MVWWGGCRDRMLTLSRGPRPPRSNHHQLLPRPGNATPGSMRGRDSGRKSRLWLWSFLGNDCFVLLEKVRLIFLTDFLDIGEIKDFTRNWQRLGMSVRKHILILRD